MQTRALLLVMGIAVAAFTAGAAQIEIDPNQSKVEVAASCTIDSFVGKLDKFESTVEVEADSPLPGRADVSFDFADLKTGSKDRDAAMLKWLDYGDHKTAAFHLTAWKSEGTNTIALGELTLHGVTKPVEMPTIVQRSGDSWDITGQTSFDYTDFGLKKIRKALFLTVNPKLKVQFHLVGTPAVAK